MSEQYFFRTVCLMISRESSDQSTSTFWSNILCSPFFFRQARLDADDDIAMAGDRSLRQGHIGPVHIGRQGMRDLKNKMWKYGSFGGTERSLTSATYFDISKAGYVT
jgi:hypothetical protein